MIDEVATFEMFGYTSDDWAPQSNKKVVAICERCGKCRVIRISQYRDLCQPCAVNSPDHRCRTSEANTGNTYRIGKHCSAETKKLIGEGNRGKTRTDEVKKRISEAHKGHVVSKETGQKISLSSKGRTHTEETKRKMSENRRGKACGKNNWRWCGGVTPWRRQFIRSNVYKNWRAAVFERDDYTCQMCSVRGGELEAHHIRPVRDHKNDLMIYDVDNGITLCKKCHRSIGNKESDYIEKFTTLVVEKK